MHRSKSVMCLVTSFLCLITNTGLFAAPTDGPIFEISIDESLLEDAGSYSGRVYVAFAGSRGGPVDGMHSWFSPPPVFALDVEGVSAGETVSLAEDVDGLLAHPVKPSELSGRYSVQAVARVNPFSPKAGKGEGDWISDVQQIQVTKGESLKIQLHLDRRVQPKPFEETDRVKMFEWRSPSLSEFYGQDFIMKAGVVLPKGFDPEGSRRYPVVYQVTGFGGDHHSAFRVAQQVADVDDVLFVVPDASCYYGHSVFADSANNGPWGHALVRELIPAIEDEFRGAGVGEHRYVTGVSSGGWSSLWLQVTYPEEFNGCFSHVPDPVDFRDFQCIDVYDPGDNFFVDENEKARALARMGTRVVLTYRDFVTREEVLGPGGQIHSFEACFSPKGEDGKPVRVFDRETGEVDADAAETWEPYDIGLVLKRGWKRLAPTLKGKLHIWAGELDTFYLEGAVRLLKTTLEDLESDAVVEVVPGMAHQLHVPGFQDMMAKIRKDMHASDLLD